MFVVGDGYDQVAVVTEVSWEAEPVSETSLETRGN